jgi:ATP-dependent helicase YprA (DUF1998 family)
MGVDVQNVRLVVHFSLPRNVEGYLQETGRAGRDGRHAACWLLLTAEDYWDQLALAHAPMLSHYHIFVLLSHVFTIENCDKASHGNNYPRIALPVKELEVSCDLTGDTIV